MAHWQSELVVRFAAGFLLLFASACGDSSGSGERDSGTDTESATEQGSDTEDDVNTIEPGTLPRASIDDFAFSGAFRFTNGDFGMSNVNYAVGTLGYNPQNHSLFIAGHAQNNGVAEYPIVPSGQQQVVPELPESGAPIQPFAYFLDSVDNSDEIDRVTGMLWYDGALIVNGETWYDAPGDNTDTTLVLADANALEGDIDGYFELSGAVHSGGYMGEIPMVWQEAFGATHYTGWSSVYSIVSRYSVGPSLWTFSPDELINGDASTDPAVTAIPFMNYAYGETHLSETAVEYAAQGETGPFDPASDLWNILSRGVYGFFVPGTRTFAVIGSSGGVETGIGYKAIQDNGNQCGGPCSYGADDNYNYYWLFDVSEILAAPQVHSPQPYDYGVWEVPFDNDGAHKVIGATLDPEGQVLYVALENAGQLGDYDRPPLILTFQL